MLNNVLDHSEGVEIPVQKPNIPGHMVADAMVTELSMKFYNCPRNFQIVHEIFELSMKNEKYLFSWTIVVHGQSIKTYFKNDLF
jgi:hypothetical protein